MSTGTTFLEVMMNPIVKKLLDNTTLLTDYELRVLVDTLVFEQFDRDISKDREEEMPSLREDFDGGAGS